jgi:hypothetical protein
MLIKVFLIPKTIALGRNNRIRKTRKPLVGLNFNYRSTVTIRGVAVKLCS